MAKVLFIEDDPWSIDRTKEILEKENWEVKVVEDADEAISELESLAQYQLIILDIMMMLGSSMNEAEAEETGTAIYKRIRAKDPTKPILVLTARGKTEIWKDFENDRFAEYFGKPIPNDKTRFFEKIRALITVR